MLAAIGLGGVVATAVQRSIHEIGVRMALGATGGDVQRMLVGQALVVAEIGVAAPLPARRSGRIDPVVALRAEV